MRSATPLRFRSVPFRLGREMPMVQVVHAPPIVVVVLGACEIMETQSQLRPTEIVPGAVHPFQHQSLW